MNTFQKKLIKGILPFVDKLDSFDKGFMQCMKYRLDHDSDDTELEPEVNTTLNAINTKVVKLLSFMPEKRVARDSNKHSDSILRSMQFDNDPHFLDDVDYEDD